MILWSLWMLWNKKKINEYCILYCFSLVDSVPDIESIVDCFPLTEWIHHYHHHHHHQSLNREGYWGITDDFSQPVFSIFLCSPRPFWTWRTPGLSIPSCCLPTSSSVCLVFFSLSLCLARWFWPDLMWRETWPYHCSLRLFTIVRSSRGPIACWILARTSPLVTWSLYGMHHTRIGLL